VTEPLVVLHVALLAIAAGGGLLLITAGVGHLRRFGGLRAVLSVQNLVPQRLQRAVAVMLVAGELGVGAGALWAMALPGRHSSTLVALEAATYLGLLLTWLKLVRTAVVDAGEGIAEVVG
jgi:hypothetical protein